MFLGGNRCLEKGTLIYAPNLRKIPVELLKAGDVVLAVDPDTLQTLPVPVEAVYDKGSQEVFPFLSRSRYGAVKRHLMCTPNHLVLTKDGLIPAGQIPPFMDMPYPEELYFSGKYDPYAYILGILIPSVNYISGEPRFALSSREYRLIVQHCKRNKLEAAVTPRGKGNYTAHGELRRILLDKCQDLYKFYSEVTYEWGMKSLKEFLGAIFTKKLRATRRSWMVMATCPTELRFLTGALKALGCAPAPHIPLKREGQVLPRIYLDNPNDIKRICTKLTKLPARYRMMMIRYADPLLAERQDKEIKFLVDHYWAKNFDGKGKGRVSPTYDIKLGGGHNLFIANEFIVQNSGKTEAGTLEAIWFATGTHPHRPDIQVPNRGRIIVESLEMFESDIVPKFQKWAPNFDAWQKVPGHKGLTSGYKLPNGSRIDVYTVDQTHKKLEGTSILWCWVNEPAPKSHIVASMRGLIDQRGDIWFTLTPLSEPWLHEDFVVKALTPAFKERYGVHRATIWDNPWLSKEEIQNFLDTLPADERLAREKGEFLHLSGRVFKQFDPAVHVIATADWYAGWPVTIGIDPHLKKAQVAVFLGMTRQGTYVVLDEVEYTGDDLAEFGWEIAKTARDNGYDVQRICADSFINQPDMVRRDIEPRKVLDTVFRDNGLPSIMIADKKNTKNPFIVEMKRLLVSKERPELGMDKDKGEPIVAPTFYVMERCRGVIRDFTNYVYKKNRRPEMTGESEEPLKVFDDFLDALKYAFLADPAFVRTLKNRPLVSLETYTGKKL